MPVKSSRRGVATVLGCLLFASAGHAQVTAERYAGGASIENVSGHTVPVSPQSAVTGPDGYVYVTDWSHFRILRVDPSTSIASVLRDATGRPITYGEIGLAFDAEGNLYLAGYDGSYDGIWRIDLANGSRTPVMPRVPDGVRQFAFGPNGRLYVVGGQSVKVMNEWGVWVDFAGSWNPAFSGDGGPAPEAELNYPRGIAFDAAGNLYIADTDNYRIRKVSAATGIITTIAGTGSRGDYLDGIPALEADIDRPYSVGVDAAGNVFFSEGTSSRIRRVDAATGLISTVIGRNGPGFYGDGGPSVDAGFINADHISVDADGNLYISDTGSLYVRRVDAATGIINSMIGNGTEGFCTDAAPRLEGCLHYPQGLATNAQGDLFISDSGNRRIRKVSAASGELTTYAGGGPGFESAGDGGPAVGATFGTQPMHISLDAAGTMFVAAGYEHRVRRIDGGTGIITTVAGTGQEGFSGDGGPAVLARLRVPNGVVVAPSGDIYIADSGNHRVRRISAETGVITTIAGSGISTGPLGDGGSALAASLNYPEGLLLDSTGNLLIVDRQHRRIRKLWLDSGTITTVAGNGSVQITGNGGPAVAAGIGNAGQIAIDPAGSIYLSAYYTSLRRIDAITGVITDAFPEGVYNSEGIYMRLPSALAFDNQGHLFVSDLEYSIVFRVDGIPLPGLDSTPPVVEANINGNPGTEGWYTSDVQVIWSVTDPESAITSQLGCESGSVTQDTAVGTTFTCGATSTGGTTTRSVTIRRDATPPTISFGAATPAADGAGWNNADVSIPFTVSDSMSGVRATSLANPVVVTGEGVGIVRNFLVFDNAGNNVSVATPPVNIDRTPPVIQHEMVADLGNNGWYLGDVTRVNFTVTEIPQSLVSISEGCDSFGFDEDTAGVTVTCLATSAGGTASSSVTIKRDATPPVLTFGAATPLPNANGWNKTNVSVPFTRNDAMSGLASTSTTSPLVISAEGAGVTGQVTVTDLAGNSATFTTTPRNIDKTPPVVNIVSPANGASFGFYQDVIGDYSCTDLSLLSCVGPTANGEAVNTKTAGARTFKVTGKDLVSFNTSVTHSFTVASLFNFDGFLAPANEPPVLNLVSRGRLVPIRWQLPDGNGGFVSNPASFTSATVASLTCGGASVVPYNNTSSGPAGIDFDPASNTFTYNWQTTASWTGCRKLTIKLRDNTLHELRFKFQ